MEKNFEDDVIDFIIEHNLIAKGERIGVGVSGGADSMALLHFLDSISKKAGFAVVAVNVNHNMREGSKKESQFVKKYCIDNGIEFIGLNVDVLALIKEKKLGLEQAARIKRYEAYENAIAKGKLNKMALGHHQSDQAETILLKIFRGSGIAGASGMDVQRGPYIRPFLETQKVDISEYVFRNHIPYIEDPSNQDNTFSRNFLRNEIIPALRREWKNVEKNVIDFGKNCRRDDDYMNSMVDTSYFISDGKVVRVPLNLFIYPEAVTNRVIISALDKLGKRENIERKHIELVQNLVKSGANGAKIDLPNGTCVIREYEYIAFVKKQTGVESKVYSFKIGKTSFADFGTISVTKSIAFRKYLDRDVLLIDVDKLPKQAKWRTRKDGDTFTKFGGGTKKLASYMIDKKIPARLRDKTPVLAHGNEIYAIAGLEISDKVKIDKDTLEAYLLESVVTE
ncbi:MAG: tRNA lysidine(34) synthetase TilS [Firmicutes bacterium]|nr:tRNA lysidine(34) synthetase TilS [Bacillota bacterium]